MNKSSRIQMMHNVTQQRRMSKGHSDETRRNHVVGLPVAATTLQISADDIFIQPHLSDMRSMRLKNPHDQYHQSEAHLLQKGTAFFPGKLQGECPVSQYNRTDKNHVHSGTE